uniref:3-methyl-2-oxobutanoate dehydrogenase (2-methylpropanoyl-transferring) n=1 Tax=Opuntia streptacantha TaxID=393608 RepID=A0A7C9CGS5_OPUST
MAMAYLARSRSPIYHRLKSKLGSIRFFDQHRKQGIWDSSMTQMHYVCPLFHLSPQIHRNRPVISSNVPIHFVSGRFESTSIQKPLDPPACGSAEALDFPGGKVRITSKMRFIPETNSSRVECYRVLDNDGRLCGESIEISKELAVKLYENMVTLRVMDTIFYEAQRQGRIPFYVTTIGEEAINIASAAALSIDDFIIPQYRESGILLWRGFTLQEFANQCFGNKDDNGKGRQMPVHYGSKKLNYITVSSTVAEQIPHAVGAAYSLKMDNKDACTVSYFGDGGSSTGDFHAALNFAAVLEVPVIFFCRNNGWAISTPMSDQMRSILHHSVSSLALNPCFIRSTSTSKIICLFQVMELLSEGKDMAYEASELMVMMLLRSTMQCLRHGGWL